MKDDPVSSSAPPKDLTQLRAKAAASSAQARKLIEQLRDLQAQTVSQRANNACLREEVRLLQIALGQVDPFP
jgi:hypothetical protein